MRKLYITGLIILSTIMMIGIGCSREKKESKRYLSEDQMIAILVDVHLTEATLADAQNRGLNPDSLKVQLYAKLFNKHDVSRDRYESSLNHYMENPKEMDAIYEKVYNRLTALQTEIHAEHNIQMDTYE